MSHAIQHISQPSNQHFHFEDATTLVRLQPPPSLFTYATLCFRNAIAGRKLKGMLWNATEHFLEKYSCIGRRCKTSKSVSAMRCTPSSLVDTVVLQSAGVLVAVCRTDHDT